MIPKLSPGVRAGIATGLTAGLAFAVVAFSTGGEARSVRVETASDDSTAATVAETTTTTSAATTTTTEAPTTITTTAPPTTTTTTAAPPQPVVTQIRSDPLGGTLTVRTDGLVEDLEVMVTYQCYNANTGLQDAFFAHQFWFGDVNGERTVSSTFRCTVTVDNWRFRSVSAPYDHIIVDAPGDAEILTPPVNPSAEPAR